MNVKQRLGIFAALVTIPLYITGCSVQRENIPQEYSTGLFAMGTYMELSAYGDHAESALAKAADRITELEALWSTTDKNSEIYALNHSGGKPVSLSSETAQLLHFILDISQQTGGALDPTIYPLVNAWGFIGHEYRIPSEEEIRELLQLTGYQKINLAANTVTLPDGMQLDLGAAGKGYAGELLANLLKEQNITSALLDIGGNIQLVGRKPDGTKWRIGVKNPFGEGSFGILEAEDCAVVTSGGYERYFTDEDGNVYWHILDPATGYPADSGLASVTIIAEDGGLGDALSTALFVMGLDEGAAYWRSRGGFEMVLMAQDGTIYLTEGIGDSFTLDDASSDLGVWVIRR